MLAKLHANSIVDKYRQHASQQFLMWIFNFLVTTSQNYNLKLHLPTTLAPRSANNKAYALPRPDQQENKMLVIGLGTITHARGDPFDIQGGFVNFAQKALALNYNLF